MEAGTEAMCEVGAETGITDQCGTGSGAVARDSLW